MAVARCDNPNCTVSTTGNCLLSHARLGRLPAFHRWRNCGRRCLGGREASGVTGRSDRTCHRNGTDIPVGNELGAEDAVEVMRARYTHLIGVLGSAGAGKTCLLSSLYLLASAGALPPPYEFCGSLTLQAFEGQGKRTTEVEQQHLTGISWPTAPFSPIRGGQVFCISPCRKLVMMGKRFGLICWLQIFPESGPTTLSPAQ